MSTEAVLDHLLNPEKVVTPRAAASVLVLRDGARGLEVLMVRRSRAVSFARGALVFPGGRVDRADRTTSVLGARLGGVGRRDDRAFRVAALREVFEETGYLLARTTEGRPVRRAEQTRLARQYRARMSSDHGLLAHMVRRTGIQLDFASLVPFAHWVTPRPSPRRFDTRFFLVRGPERQKMRVDGTEIVDAAWRRPQDILAEWEDELVDLMFPTRLNLHKLADAASVAEAIGLARTAPPRPVTPEFSLHKGRLDLTIPESAGFGVTRASRKDLDFRMVGATGTPGRPGGN